MKKLVALDVIDSAVGRCAEMGKPLLFSPGISLSATDALTSVEGSQNLAGLAVLSHVAKLTAKYRVPLIVAVKNPELMPIADNICMLSYKSEGQGDAILPTWCDILREISLPLP